MGLQSGTPATEVRIGLLAGHQFAMPSKNGVGPRDGRDLPKYPTPKPMRQFGKSAPLGVIQSKSPPFKLRLEDAVLFTQERDDVVLLVSKPTAQRCDQELERKHVRSPRQRRAFGFWDNTGTVLKNVAP